MQSRTARDGVEFSVATQETNDGSMTVRLDGDLDLTTTEPIMTAVRVALGHRPMQCTIDLAGVTFCDTRGMQSLVAASNECMDDGVPCQLVEAQSNVRRVFELFDFDALLS